MNFKFNSILYFYISRYLWSM